MLESQRHRLILSVLREKPVASIHELVELTQSSEATIRRDISALDKQNKINKTRGGAEAINIPATSALAGRPFSYNRSVNVAQKRAIAHAAVELCDDGDAIIINGGTTTYQMVHHLANRRMQVFTNSFPIADHLLSHTQNSITMPGGTIYREQNIVLSPFENDGSQHFAARRMFMGVTGITSFGVMEIDPLVVQAEEKLMSQAEELVVLADATKFGQRSSQILCPLDRVSTIITDDRITDEAREMVEKADIDLVVVKYEAGKRASVA